MFFHLSLSCHMCTCKPWHWANMHSTSTLTLRQLNGIQPSWFYYLHMWFSCCDISKRLLQYTDQYPTRCCSSGTSLYVTLCKALSLLSLQAADILHHYNMPTFAFLQAITDKSMCVIVATLGNSFCSESDSYSAHPVQSNISVVHTRL